MEKIVSTGKTSDGQIIIEITKEDGQIQKEYLRGTRIGLSWPGTPVPGYFTVIGQGTKKGINGKYPLWLLVEGEDQIPDRLFRKMADNAAVFHCWEILTDISERYRGYVLDFLNFKKKERNLQDLSIKEAPFYQSFSHGIFILQDWVRENALILPRDGLAHSQLKGVTADDLKRDPGEKYHAINGLRYVVASFEISDATPRNARNRKQSSAPPVGAFS